MGTIISREKGQTIILVALLITVLLLFVGIAIDSGIAYGVKAKLSSAVDAAALAAGKALGQPGTDAGRIANATSAAETFFAANFPDGYLMAAPTLQNTVIAPNDPIPGQWKITVTASATVPTIFLKLGGRTTFTSQSAAVATRRDLDMAFVIDTTDSMEDVSGGVNGVRSAATTFVNYFIESSDRMALLHFAYGTVVDDPIRTSVRGFDKSSVTSNINSLNYNLGGFTNYSEAFWRARDQLNSIPDANRSSQRVIVFFTDGSPNSLSATFTHMPGPSQTTRTGVIQTSAGATGTPEGLWEVGQQNTPSPSPWHPGNILNYISPTLPQYFNCTFGNTNPTAYTEFPVWPHAAVGPRNALSLNASATYANINRASRNLPEDMALSARLQGIFVYTLGLGDHLNEATGPDNERGDILLKRMANDPTADTYNPGQPVGMYCYAADTEALRQCYDKVASKILRLTN